MGFSVEGLGSRGKILGFYRDNATENENVQGCRVVGFSGFGFGDSDLGLRGLGFMGLGSMFSFMLLQQTDVFSSYRTEN